MLYSTFSGIIVAYGLYRFNAFDAYRDSCLPVCKPSQCMSVVIHTCFDTINPLKLHCITLALEFDDISYDVAHATNYDGLLGHDYDGVVGDENKVNEQAYHTTRIIDCMRAQYEGHIIAHICVDNELLRREIERRFTGVPYLSVHTYETDPLWRTNTTLMDILFQFAEPRKGIVNPLPSWEHIGRFCDIVRDYKCHIPLNTPYHVCYESDKENEENVPFLYPLLICLDYHKEKGLTRK